jgi:hypothetical protein
LQIGNHKQKCNKTLSPGKTQHVVILLVSGKPQHVVIVQALGKSQHVIILGVSSKPQHMVILKVPGKPEHMVIFLTSGVKVLKLFSLSLVHQMNKLGWFSFPMVNL